ncbi:hypothetical protein CDAR_305561 [Caerostris darwini]|uniref:Uncharacterized protein n=1 Tax=Caerostris darwini TaxID=1538125 RepID=A0AAV4RGS0_9ARAC|nr:hypothetical protein CDAR_305561 [Caerostris darwini]
MESTSTPSEGEIFENFGYCSISDSSAAKNEKSTSQLKEGSSTRIFEFHSWKSSRGMVELHPCQFLVPSCLSC